MNEKIVLCKSVEEANVFDRQSGGDYYLDRYSESLGGFVFIRRARRAAE